MVTPTAAEKEIYKRDALSKLGGARSQLTEEDRFWIQIRTLESISGGGGGGGTLASTIGVTNSVGTRINPATDEAINNLRIAGVGATNAANARINPATQETLAEVLAAIQAQGTGGAAGDIGIKNIADAQVNPATEEAVQALVTRLGQALTVTDIGRIDDAAGARINPATQETLADVLAAIQAQGTGDTGIKNIADAQINPATEEAVQALITRLGQALTVTDIGRVNDVAGDQVNPATQETLALVLAAIEAQNTGSVEVRKAKADGVGYSDGDYLLIFYDKDSTALSARNVSTDVPLAAPPPSTDLDFTPPSTVEAKDTAPAFTLNDTTLLSQEFTAADLKGVAMSGTMTGFTGSVPAQAFLDISLSDAGGNFAAVDASNALLFFLSDRTEIMLAGDDVGLDMARRFRIRAENMPTGANLSITLREVS